jgi:hypothetical protein
VDVLEQILLEAPIPLAGGGEARKRRPEFGNGGGVEIVLPGKRRLFDGAGRRRAHVQVVVTGRNS